MLPKYSKLEIERRWLVAGSSCPALDERSRRLIEDLYVSDTRLRLRKITYQDGRVEFKLCKKYGRTDKLSEPITNLYLTEDEYLVLRGQLIGTSVEKCRYDVESGSLDVYSGATESVMVFSVEFDSTEAAERYAPPYFVSVEVSSDPHYSGATLASTLKFPNASVDRA